MDDNPISAVHEAFISAFSDYSVKVDMTLEMFKAFLKSNSVDLSLSVGSFNGGLLCGFILNGIRVKSGTYTAYDSGTGVIPQYRKHAFPAVAGKRYNIYKHRHAMCEHARISG